ncbi:MAG TPA: DUF3288 domain-containing protein [Cyanobacteria bacterium UBA8156]|jgi:hypothetical protein|nr:DUF3288 domain-containing protein [Cyanobacteria bacterium UBA8156]
MAAPKDQQHPQYTGDRQVVNELLTVTQPGDRHLADLGRLRIRYHGFPGARDIQTDLDRLLQQWGLTEEELFAQTRVLHQGGRVYTSRQEGRDDWA